MKIKLLFLATGLLFAHSTLKAQLLADISFGYDQSVFSGNPSPYDSVGDTWGKLKDSSGTLLTGSNSVAGIGYFTATPTSFSANPTLFDDFVFLASGLVQNSGGILNLSVTQTNVDVTAAAGEKAYLAFFKGITSVSNYTNAIELGLVSAMTWDNLTGTEALSLSVPTPLSYSIGRTAIDSSNGGTGGVYIGSEEDDARFSSGEGFNYLTAPVPETSTYALLLGSLALACVLRRRS